MTIAGVQVGSLLGGAVLVETVFGWPGLGRLAYDAVFQRDSQPAARHPAALARCSSSLVNLVVDLLYAVLDPTDRMPVSELLVSGGATAATSPR